MRGPVFPDCKHVWEMKSHWRRICTKCGCVDVIIFEPEPPAPTEQTMDALFVEQLGAEKGEFLGVKWVDATARAKLKELNR
jgi:hypothetical protein